jgi:putative endonuclease
MYYVYILQSLKDSKFYTGLTNDLSRRLQEHNSGQMKSTKGRVPFKLLYSEKYETRIEARAREKFFKTGGGRELRDEIARTSSIPR